MKENKVCERLIGGFTIGEIRYIMALVFNGPDFHES
jgi:hypothetical protein